MLQIGPRFPYKVLRFGTQGHFTIQGQHSMLKADPGSSPDDVTIREAVPDDVPTIAKFLRALAEYQETLDYFRATTEDLARDGFGPERQFETLMAESEGEPVGLAIDDRVGQHIAA